MCVCVCDYIYIRSHPTAMLRKPIGANCTACKDPASRYATFGIANRAPNNTSCLAYGRVYVAQGKEYAVNTT